MEDPEMEKRLRARGRMLATARQAERNIREGTVELAIEARIAGFSLHRIAELLGVDRMTVRKWVGKR